MERISKLSLVFISAIFLISLSSASTFGSFPEQVEKQSDDLNVEYRLNLVNLGEKDLEITLRAQNSDEYNVSFSEKIFTLEPNVVEDSPEGSGWYHIGNGRYTKLETVSMDVEISRYRESNDLVFPVQVRARPVSGEGSSVSSRLVRVRDHNFRAVLDPSLRPETREEEEEEIRFWNEEDEEEDFNFEDSEPTVGEEGEGESQENQSNMKTNRSTTGNNEEENEESSGINKFTFLFAGGIAVSISYILLVA